MVTQNDKKVESERVKTSLVSIRRLVASLSPFACITGLLFIQSEITAVDRKIVPANSSTVKANVTIIPLTKVTGIYN